MEAIKSSVYRVFHYVVYERNPIVQIIYVLAMGGCYIIYVMEAHPYMPNKFVGNEHKWLSALLFAACGTLYGIMCMTDPGVITKENVEEFTQYPPHPVLYPADKYCRTCKTLKYSFIMSTDYLDPSTVASAITVSLALTIIWFNNCVGSNNYRYFLLYLIAQTFVCLEGFYVTTSVFLTQAEAMVNGKSTYDNLRYVIQRNQPLGFVAAMTLMTILLVWIFFLIQLYRIGRNTTANETFKRDRLMDEVLQDDDSIRSTKKLFNYLLGKVTSQESKTNRSRKEKKKELDASWGGLFQPDAIFNTEQTFSKQDLEYNPYDMKSFHQNLQDALQLRQRMPPDLQLEKKDK